MTPMQRILAAHGIGTAVAITAWQVAIAAPAGPADVKLVLAGLTIPTLCAGGSLLAIAVAEGRKQQAATAPVRRRQVAAPQRRELAG